MTAQSSSNSAKSYRKDSADHEIERCLDSEVPVSFFLFAGAGSGKTGSLVSALNHIIQTQSRRLRLSNQRVGVITYTVAASEEIIERIQFSPLVEVSTIHSFIWSLIKGFDADIKVWVAQNLDADIAELRELQRKGRSGKASITREKSIASKQKRLAGLSTVKRFTYNPNGENRGRDSLNHAEVIKLGAEFLANKPLMRSLLVNKYPILFIDESQDTTRALIEAFMMVEERERTRFRVGLFGDMMQRIYADGKADLGRVLPEVWAKPAKMINYRCPRRVVALINRLRSSVDGQHQEAQSDAVEGVARIFLVNINSEIDKPRVERRARERMAIITADDKWNDSTEVKTLILEHRMAAKRLGFLEMFSALYEADSLRTGLLDGTLAGLQVFSRQVLPLILAAQKADEFAIASIARKYSPLLSKEALQAAGEAQPAKIRLARDGTRKLISLFTNDGKPSFAEVLRCVFNTNLFEIPDALRPIALRMSSENDASADMGNVLELDDDVGDPVLDAWDAFLLTPFGQIGPYIQYVEGNAPFDTHQGIKGREFPRVLVIIDDEDARGFMFSYEKLFGAKAKSQTDIENERDGKETGLDRTRRLFYVTCSRAKSSLGIVAYTRNPAIVRGHIVEQDWFSDSEIEVLS
jgi:DNA helicase II / ATP-dependent DNA helicase PcrA